MPRSKRRRRVALPAFARSIFVFAVAFLALNATVSAQDCPYPDSLATADTLQGAAYYPLSLGNIWEYEITRGDSLIGAEKREIVGYAIFKNIFYYRFDSRLFVVEDDSVLALDTLITDYALVTDSSIVVNGSASPVARDVNFSASFKSCYLGRLRGSEEDLVIVDGATPGSVSFFEDGLPTTYSVPATKSFTVESDTSIVFAFGIGLIEATGSVNRSLVYALVEGLEYGTPLSNRFAIPTTAHFSFPSKMELVVFPIPARNRLNIEVTNYYSSAITLSIYDVVGRLARTQSIHQPRGVLSMDVSDLAAGVYVLAVEHPGVTSLSRPIVIN